MKLFCIDLDKSKITFTFAGVKMSKAIKLIESTIKKYIMEDDVNDPRYVKTQKRNQMQIDRERWLKRNPKLAAAIDKNPKIEKIYDFFNKELVTRNLWGTFEMNGDLVFIEPKTPQSGEYDGMHITYDPSSGEYEVSEQMAGENANELHIFTVTKSPQAALKSLLMGNKNRKPIKIWK